jgi:hypothetical protein
MSPFFSWLISHAATSKLSFDTKKQGAICVKILRKLALKILVSVINRKISKKSCHSLLLTLENLSGYDISKILPGSESQ